MIRQWISGAVQASILGLVCFQVPTAAQAAAANGQDDARALITQAEKDWVASVVSGKTDVLEPLVAADVVAVDFQGQVMDKATMLAEIKGAPKFITSNVLDKVDVRFFGDDVAVAQGSETFEGQNGMPKKGQFIFTDTWLKRNGSWQLVANEALMVPEPAK